MFAPSPTRLRRTFDALIAFATLADAEPPPHPHRRPLRRPHTHVARRPGTPAPRPQLCRAPVGARTAGSGAEVRVARPVAPDQAPT